MLSTCTHIVLQLVPPAAMKDSPANAITTFNVGATLFRSRHPIFAIKVGQLSLLHMMSLNTREQWSPDGRRVITSSSTGEFTVWAANNFAYETVIQVRLSSITLILLTWRRHTSQGRVHWPSHGRASGSSR